MLLMHKNTPVAKLNMLGNKIIDFKEIININELPIGTLGATKQQEQILINHWYKSRSIPNQRMGIYGLESKLGVSTSSELFIKNAGISLTDTFWIKDEEKDANITWEDVNFYDNGFTPIFANYYLDGDKDIEFQKSPDFTTDGIMEKFWYSVHDKPYLAKIDNKRNGILSANEVVVSEIAGLMDIKTTPYIYGQSNYGNFCSCPCFIDNANEDFITAMQVKHSNFQLSSINLLNYFKNKLGFEKEMRELISLDVFFHNTDRHEKNFGFAKGINGNRFIPAFDNGYCLGANRTYGHPITDRDMKLFNDTREEILDNFGMQLPIDRKQFQYVLQKNYEMFNIPEQEYEIAKEELDYGCDLMERGREFVNIPTYKSLD